MGKYTQDYLMKEYHKFREIMCSRKYTVEQKQNAYRGLMWVYLNAGNILDNATICLMDALDIEYARRIAHEIIKPLRDLTTKIPRNLQALQKNQSV